MLGHPAALAAVPAAVTIPAREPGHQPGCGGRPGVAGQLDDRRAARLDGHGRFTAEQYGAPAFLTTADGAALGGGANFFAGGNTEQSVGAQPVNVTGAAAEIDAGGVSATLSALLGGYSSQEDHATVTATFLDAGGAPLGAARRCQR